MPMIATISGTGGATPELVPLTQCSPPIRYSPGPDRSMTGTLASWSQRRWWYRLLGSRDSSKKGLDARLQLAALTSTAARTILCL